MSPNNQCFIGFLLTNFRKLEFMSGNFFRKILNNFPKNLIFFNVFKIGKTIIFVLKTIIFVLKVIQNHYNDKNLTKLSLKTPKTANFV